MTKTSTIPEQQVSHYLHGYCPQLAGAIWEAVRFEDNWSLAIVTTDGGESGHIITRIPTGEYLDVRGLWTANEMRAAYPDADLFDVGSDWLEERGWDIYTYTAEDVRVARALVTGLGLGELDWDRAENAVL